MSMQELSTRLKQAAGEGLVVGVKWAIVITVVGMTWAFLVGDYLATRQRSVDAVNWINAQMAAAQRQQQQSQPPVVK